DTLELADPIATHRFAAPGLRALALDWELLDPRETTCLAKGEDFASDLRFLQARYQEFSRAPQAAEVERFPGRELVNDMIAFNREYEKRVSRRLEIDMVNADVLRATLEETDHLFRVYGALQDARSEYPYVTYRRQALARLRDLIGFEAFYTG